MDYIKSYRFFSPHQQQKFAAEFSPVLESRPQIAEKAVCVLSGTEERCDRDFLLGSVHRTVLTTLTQSVPDTGAVSRPPSSGHSVQFYLERTK